MVLMRVNTVPTHRRILAAVVLTACVLLGRMPCQYAAGGDSAEKTAEGKISERQLGKTIRIQLPITGGTFDRVRQFVRRAVEKACGESARLVLIFEFNVPEGQDEFGRGSQFGAAYDLADFLSSEELVGVRTVAYLPQSIQGHAVLVVLGCDEIIMAGDARLGPAGVDERVITQSRLGSYREIARRRKTVPAEVALWLLDPTQDVLAVETEVSREYVTAEGLAELEKHHTIKSQQKMFDHVNPERSVAAQRGALTGEEARRMGFAAYLADNRREVAEALELPSEAMDEDISLIDDWRAVRIDLKGPISAKMIDRAQRLIDEEIRLRDVNFVCLWIDSPGGSPTDSIVLSGFLADLDPNSIRTVAYVPVQARSDAALIALACQQLVVHPRAELGGSGAYALSEEDVLYTVEAIRDKDGPWRSQSWSLVAAMINPNLEVFRCTRLGKVGYFCDEELAELDAVKPNWHRAMQVTRPGRPLLVDGDRAVEYGLADRTVESFAQFKQYYGLQNDPALLEPGWADFLVDALASPGVAAVLLTIAFIALYAEISSPGIGIGGFAATVCFLLFFWSHYLDGTAGWLEILLFVTGVSCLLLELFVLPGFGIFGLGGGFLVLLSLILASQTFILPQNEYQFGRLQRSLLTIAGAGAGIIAVGWFLRKWLPRAPILNRILLPPPAGEEAENIRRHEALVNLDDLVGAHGAATTQLTPCGKARFRDMLVDVITDGDIIDRGATVEVVEVHGNRVIVKKA